jgi:multiple sugar transport system substrate-binding protein
MERQPYGAVSRRSLAIGTVAAGAVLWAACGPLRPPAREAGPGSKEAQWTGVQEIEVWSTSYPPVVEAYKQLVEQFHRENPRVRIKDLGTKSGTPTDLIPAVAGGKAPAVAEVNQPNAWEFAGKSVYVPLDNYIKRDKSTSEALKDFYPGVLEHVTWRGQLHFLPVGISMEVWHVNTELWNRAGLELPKARWTWDDLATKFGPALKKAVGEDGSPFMMELNELYRLLAFIHQNGGDLFAKSGTKLTIAEPPVLEAVAFVQELVKNEIIREKNPKKGEAGPERGERPGGTLSRYVTGQVYQMAGGDTATELEGMTRIPRYRQAIGATLAVIPAPTRKVQSAVYDSWEIGVVNTENPVQMEAAYQWASWFIKPENLLVYLKQRANLPPRRAVGQLRNAADLWAAEPLVKMAMEYLNYGKTFPFTPATGPMRRGINAVLGNIFRLGDPPAQTLQDLQKSLMAQYGSLLQ